MKASKPPDNKTNMSLRQLVLLTLASGAAVLAWRIPAIGVPLTVALTVYLALDATVDRS